MPQNATKCTIPTTRVPHLHNAPPSSHCRRAAHSYLNPMIQCLPRLLLLATLSLCLPRASAAADAQPVQISGVYPHLAAFNDHGECGIGAVVPWAGKLWYLTYPPHFRNGSTDKLYE